MKKRMLNVKSSIEEEIQVIRGKEGAGMSRKGMSFLGASPLALPHLHGLFLGMRWLIKADTYSALAKGKAQNGEGFSPPITWETALSNAHFQSRPLDRSLEIIPRDVKCPDCR